MIEKKPSLVDQRRSTPEGLLGMAAARLAIKASRLLLEAFAARKDIGQRDLAESVGVTEGRVSQVLHGDGNVHVATLARYMAALGYELELTAKPIDSMAPSIRPKPKRGKNRSRAGREPITFDRGPVKFVYRVDTIRESGMGHETIELHANPGEAPPWPMSAPVLVANKEIGQFSSLSTASEEVRERTTKVFARQR